MFLLKILKLSKLSSVLKATFFIGSFFLSIIANSQETLELDPDLLILLKESQNVAMQLEEGLYPDWNFRDTPVLLYKPGIQELLINFPHLPEGFEIFKGFNPLEGQSIYVRNGITYIPYDDQNTTIKIDGVKVLVVADTFSSMRNQLRGAMMNQPKSFLNEWLDNWDFIGSPIHKIGTILHEGFHVYQEQMAEEKYANEAVIADYPLLDPINNSLSVLEGLILKDALFSNNEEEVLRKRNQFVAVRNYRHSLLGPDFVEYENLNEFSEGTAKYVEFKFFSLGENIASIQEMQFVNGYKEYKSLLPEFFKNEIEDMVNIVSVNDNRFGNMYGTGPIRYKLYYLGACQGLLLDKVMPNWKEKIFDEGVYLSNLLFSSANLNSNQLNDYLEQAKLEYNYDDIYNDKLKFETEGKKLIQEKVDNIMSSVDKTLVVLDYSDYRIRGLNHTPFGITKINDDSTIYDMVPIGVHFDKDSKLISKLTFPVLIDSKEKKLYFSIDTIIEEGDRKTKLAIKEFDLFAESFNIKKEGNRIVITLE